MAERRHFKDESCSAPPKMVQRKTGADGAAHHKRGDPCPRPDSAARDRSGKGSAQRIRLNSAIIADFERRNLKLPGFHKSFIRAAFAPDIQIAALSVPRGSAKTFLAAQLAAQAITPGSPTYIHGREVLAVSASFEQSRVLMQFVKEALQYRDGEFRFLDSGQRLQTTHKSTGTKLRVLSSSGKRAMGLANFSTIFADEPAAWEARGGALMFDALRTSLGKQDGQRLILIGTRAPAEPDGWWPQLLDAGSGPGKHVTVRTAPDAEPWDAWQTIRRVNPLVSHSQSLRETILRERDEARKNDRARAAFEAYRLNRQVDVREEILVSVAAWKRAEERQVPDRWGQPIAGLDVGGERSWSAACLLFENGRAEALALVPGVPDLAERERQDAMPRGLYQRLTDHGRLLVDEGRRMARIELLLDEVLAADPAVIICDRFLLGAVHDVVAGQCPVVERRVRWSEASDDIAAFRRMVLDGPLAVEQSSRALLRVSMSGAACRSDDQGSCRLLKRKGKRSRDDVAQAAVLAAGAWERARAEPDTAVQFFVA